MIGDRHIAVHNRISTIRVVRQAFYLAKWKFAKPMNSPPHTLASEREPVVSVVMSVYNGLPYVAEAVQSILDQTYRNIDFVIIDDGSSDGSTELLRRFAAKDRRIRLIEQQNTGLTKALIAGFDLARGEFIARMDADDVSRPNRLAVQLALLQSDPTAAAATCRSMHFHDTRGPLRVSDPLPSTEAISWHLMFFNKVGGHGQVMFRKSAYLEAGGYDPAFTCAQDYDLWVRLFRHFKLLEAPDDLYIYRVGGEGAISSRRWREQQDFSFDIAGRAYAQWTGVKLDRLELQRLRQFWSRTGETAFGREEIAPVDLLLTQAYVAYFDANPRLRHCRAAIRADVSARWMYWAHQAGVRDPRLAFAYFARAVRWNWGSAFTGLARLARRLVRGAPPQKPQPQTAG